MIAFLYYEAGGIAAAQGDVNSARLRFQQALSAVEKSDSKLDVVNFLDEIAIFAARIRAYETAAQFGGTMDPLPATWKMLRTAFEAPHFTSAHHYCRTALP